MQAYIYILMCGTISRGSASSRSKLSRGRRASVGLDLSGSRWPPRRGAKRPAFLEDQLWALAPSVRGSRRPPVSASVPGLGHGFGRGSPGDPHATRGSTLVPSAAAGERAPSIVGIRPQRKHIGSCVDSAVRDVPGSQGPTWIGPLPRAYAVPGHRKIPQGRRVQQVS